MLKYLLTHLSRKQCSEWATPTPLCHVINQLRQLLFQCSRAAILYQSTNRICDFLLANDSNGRILYRFRHKCIALYITLDVSDKSSVTARDSILWAIKAPHAYNSLILLFSRQRIRNKINHNQVNGELSYQCCGPHVKISVKQIS